MVSNDEYLHQITNLSAANSLHKTRRESHTHFSYGPWTYEHICDVGCNESKVTCKESRELGRSLACVRKEETATRAK
jgi:hypothetical protein